MIFSFSEAPTPYNHEKPSVFMIRSKNLFLSEKDSMNIFISLDKTLIFEKKFSSALYVGELNSKTVYALELEEFTPQNTEYILHLVLMEKLSENELNAFFRANQLLNWDKVSKFCGCCGGETKISEKEFSKACLSCDKKIYPQYSPAVIVLIRDESRLLLSRSRSFRPGVFSATAGFIEAGETAVQAVHREVKEELNVNVKNIYSFDTASWPFPNSFMLGFIAEYDSGDLKIDTKEIEAAAWFDYKNLPKLPPKTGLSYRLIQEGVRLCREADINNNFKIGKFLGIKGSLIISLFTLSGLHYLKYTNTPNGVKETILQIGVSVVSGMLYADQFFKSTFRNTRGFLDYKKAAKHCLFFCTSCWISCYYIK